MKQTLSKGNKFEIRVDAYFDEEHSQVEQEKYVYIYSIRIKNLGRKSAQLLKRKWLITNEDGESLIVRGDGVVGEQPVILPNNSYRYTSGVVLETEIGTMEGEYTMRDERGKEFKIPIKKFTLSVPRLLH